MNTFSASCIAAFSLACVGCKSTEKPLPASRSLELGNLASMVVDTTRAKTVPSTISEIKDTAGVGAFIDSLRADVKKGRLDFVRRHFAEGAREDGIFFGLWDEGGAFKDNPKFVEATAALLAWTMRWGRLSIDTLAFKESDGEWLIFYPVAKLDTSLFTSANGDEADGEEDDSCRVLVRDTSSLLFDAIGGRPIGSVGSQMVCQLENVGGHEPHGYAGRIGTKWMKIRTKDGREGWLAGDSLVDLAGPGLSLRLIHRKEGWRIANFALWNDEG